MAKKTPIGIIGGGETKVEGGSIMYDMTVIPKNEEESRQMLKAENGWTDEDIKRYKNMPNPFSKIPAPSMKVE